MRLTIDLQAAQTPSAFRGIGRYSVNLARAIDQYCLDTNLKIVLNGLHFNSIEKIKKNFSQKVSFSQFYYEPAFVESLEKISHYLLDYHYAQIETDIVHISSVMENLALISNSLFELPLITSATFYDLIPLIFQDKYMQNPVAKEWYYKKFNLFKKFDLLLAISEASRKDSISYLNINPDSVFNISGAVDDIFTPIPISEEDKIKFIHKYALKEKFILYTGGLDFRKNVLSLIKAYAELPFSIRNNHNLVIVCECKSEHKEEHFKYAKSCGLSENELVMTGFVPDEDLIKFYNLCSLFVFPSLYEGFGLPILEAMSCGAPVIGSNVSSIPEIINYKPAYFNEKKTDDISRLIYECITNDAFRKTLRMHSLERSKAFSWENTAKLACAAYQQILDNKKAEKNILVAGIVSRKKIAFFSPMPPQQCGIASYSCELLLYLQKYYEIDLYVEDEALVRSANLSHCTVLSVNSFNKNHQNYYTIIYQLGNSHYHFYMYDFLKKYPGIVVLHDFFLGDSLRFIYANDTSYRQLALHCHGGKINSLTIHQISTEFPLNRFVIDNAKGVILHSKFNLLLIKKFYDDKIRIPVKVIPHLRAPKLFSDELKHADKISLNFRKNDFLICTFGNVIKSKMGEALLDAFNFSKLSKIERVKLVFVGATEINLFEELSKKIKDDNLKNQIIFTEAVSDEKYNAYLNAADFAIQLRTRTRGETSGAVLDCMAAKLPIIVNNYATFQDYPEDVVFKISENPSIEEIAKALEELYDNENKRLFLANNAYEYIKKFHDPQAVALQYCHAIEEFTERFLRKDRNVLLNKIGNILSSEDCGDRYLYKIAQCAVYNAHID